MSHSHSRHQLTGLTGVGLETLALGGVPEWLAAVHAADKSQPSIGAWASYGLGALSDNLHEFVVLGGPNRCYV